MDGIYYAINTTDSLSHHGTKGMRWGRRRYQNEDGTLTPEGIIHYGRKKEMGGISRVIWEDNKEGGPIDPIGSAILSGVGTTILSNPLYGAATAAAVLAGTAGYNAVIKKVANHKINKDDNVEKAHNALGLDYESQLKKSNRKSAVDKYINKQSVKTKAKLSKDPNPSVPKNQRQYSSSGNKKIEDKLYDHGYRPIEKGSSYFGKYSHTGHGYYVDSTYGDKYVEDYIKSADKTYKDENRWARENYRK